MSRETPKCQCGRLLNWEGEYGEWFCFSCQAFRSFRNDLTATLGPYGKNSPASESVQIPTEIYKNEPEVVEAIRKALEARGWLIYRIGQHIVKGSGSDAGVPDMLCVRPGVPPFTTKTVLLEVKFGKNGLTAEQKKLVEIGASFEVRSVAEALERCGEVE
jgi:hypothetical protein